MFAFAYMSSWNAVSRRAANEPPRDSGHSYCRPTLHFVSGVYGATLLIVAAGTDPVRDVYWKSMSAYANWNEKFSVSWPSSSSSKPSTSASPTFPG